MTDTIELRAFLKKHDYLVKVTMGKNSCNIQLPQKTIGGQYDAFGRNYTLKTGKNNGVLIADEYIQSKFIECLPYASRLAVWSDIWCLCQERGYDIKAVEIHDVDGKDVTETQELLDILPAPKNARVKVLEDQLLDVFIEAFNHDFNDAFDDIADTYDVGPGYLQIKKLFKPES